MSHTPTTFGFSVDERTFIYVDRADRVRRRTGRYSSAVHYTLLLLLLLLPPRYAITLRCRWEYDDGGHTTRAHTHTRRRTHTRRHTRLHKTYSLTHTHAQGQERTRSARRRRSAEAERTTTPRYSREAYAKARSGDGDCCSCCSRGDRRRNARGEPLSRKRTVECLENCEKRQSACDNDNRRKVYSVSFRLRRR